MIEITAEMIERAELMLSEVPKGAERALSAAMNRGVSHLKTQAFKEVRKVYAVKKKDLSEATRISVKKASTGSLIGEVHFAGTKIPLYKFSVTPKSPGSRKAVKAGVKKGGGTVFKEAFIAQMSSGHVGMFERTGVQGIESRLEKTKKQGGNKHTEQIEEKMGLSAVQMIQNIEVMDTLEKEAQEKVNERVMHEIDRILNGYGGKG